MTSPLYPDDLADRLKKRAGEKYRPSNGMEGEMFIGRWCGNCQKDAAFRDGTGDSCPIVAASLAFDLKHPDYPPEWQIGEDGQPKCAAFELDAKQCN